MLSTHYASSSYAMSTSFLLRAECSDAPAALWKWLLETGARWSTPLPPAILILGAGTRRWRGHEDCAVTLWSATGGHPL